MSAYNDLDTAVLGLPYGLGERIVESPMAGEAINYGAGVAGYIGDDANVYGIKVDAVTITFDANFVALNSIVFTINGVALDAVVYASSNANTYALIKTAIEAAVAGSSVTVDASAKTVAIFTKGANLTATVAVTAGVSQPVGTPVSSNAQIFKGVALFTQKSSKTSTGGYAHYESINLLRLGQVWVYASVAVSANQKAYVVVAAGATQGQFTNVSSGNLLTNCVFRSNTTGAGMVRVEVLTTKNI